MFQILIKILWCYLNYLILLFYLTTQIFIIAIRATIEMAIFKQLLSSIMSAMVYGGRSGDGDGDGDEVTFSSGPTISTA
jgi:hypothetical protein